MTFLYGICMHVTKTYKYLRSDIKKDLLLFPEIDLILSIHMNSGNIKGKKKKN